MNITKCDACGDEMQPSTSGIIMDSGGLRVRLRVEPSLSKGSYGNMVAHSTDICDKCMIKLGRETCDILDKMILKEL